MGWMDAGLVKRSDLPHQGSDVSEAPGILCCGRGETPPELCSHLRPVLCGSALPYMPSPPGVRDLAQQGSRSLVLWRNGGPQFSDAPKAVGPPLAPSWLRSNGVGTV